MKQNSLRKSALALRTSVVLMAGLAPMASHACSGAGDSFIGTICTFAFNFCPSGFLAADGSTLQIRSYSALYALLGTAYGGDGVNTFALPDLRGRMVVGTGTGMINGTPLTPVALGQKDGQEKLTLTGNQMAAHVHPATFTSSGGTAQASGPVSLPVTVNVPSQNLSVSGSVKIANSTASGLQSVSANAVLAKGGAPANVYAPSSVTADTNIGPAQTFTGSTTAASISTTAAGTVTLPVSGSITGGTVTVGANPTTQSAVATIPPRLGLTTCIATEGVFPMRP